MTATVDICNHAEQLPLISVITPSLNQGRFLRDAILSIAGQDACSYEHIVVDGGSQDETGDVLAQFPHLRVISEPDDGQSDALNKGFLAARAPIVCWLNADDYLLPGAFAAALRELDNGRRLAAAFGHYYMVDTTGSHLRSMRTPRFLPAVNRHYGVVTPTSGSFFASAIFQEKRILLDVGYRIVMDWDFYERLNESGVPICHTGDFLAAFRVHGDNLSLGTPGDDSPRRRRLDTVRSEERARFHRTYGPDIMDERLRTRVVAGLLHAQHARLIAHKTVRGYYLANRRDKYRRPSTRPAW